MSGTKNAAGLIEVNPGKVPTPRILTHEQAEASLALHTKLFGGGDIDTWRRLAWEAMKFLTPEQVGVAAKRAGAPANIYTAATLAAPPNNTEKK